MAGFRGWTISFESVARKVCFVMVLQGSEPRRNISIELTPAFPGSPALAAASHFSKTGWESHGGDEFALCACEIAKQNLEIPSASFFSFRPVNSGLLTLVRPAQGAGEGSIAGSADTCSEGVLGRILSESIKWLRENFSHLI